MGRRREVRIVILSEAKNLVLYLDVGNKYKQRRTNLVLAEYARDEILHFVQNDTWKGYAYPSLFVLRPYLIFRHDNAGAGGGLDYVDADWELFF